MGIVLRLLAVLSSILLLAMFVVAKQESDTIRCFGNLSMTIVGGASKATKLSFNCPTCMEPEFCSEGRDLCFLLSARKVHIFRQGTISQSSLTIPSGCDPLRIIEVDPGYEYVVQCVSKEPQYQPVSFLIYSNNEETGFIADEEVTIIRNGQSYAPLSDNNVIITSEGSLYSISLLSNPNQLVVVYYNTYVMTITGCETNHRLHAGPVVNDSLQVLVDCTTAEGTVIRQRVLISKDSLNSNPNPVFQKLHSPLSNDTVRFSPEGSHILYKGTSQVLLIQTNQISGTPGIISFDRPVAQVEFLRENQLLISVPGKNRRVVDISLFFENSFNNGVYELQNSVANCPHGLCPPFVLNGTMLYLLSNDQSLQTYTTLSSYNLENLSAEPTAITRTLRTNEFSICFHTVASISVLNPPTTPSDPPITPEPTTADSTTTTSTTEEPRTGVVTQQVDSFSKSVLISISVAAVFLVVCLCAGVALCYVRFHKRCFKGTTLKFLKCQETGVPLSNLVNSLPAYCSSRTTGSADISNTASSTVSLENLQNPSQESVAAHYPLPPESLAKKGLAATTQRVTGYE